MSKFCIDKPVYDKLFTYDKLVQALKIPDAQFPLAVPPFEAHSLDVKHVPFITFVAVDIAKMHWLNVFKKKILLLTEDCITKLIIM
jgi:hypothetical protein